MGLVTAGATAWRRFRGPVEERRGLGLLALGTALMALSFLRCSARGPTRRAPRAPAHAPRVPGAVPAAILVCVLRNRLWGIDLVLSRATVAAMLAVGLAVVYAVVVVLATTVVDGPAAQVVAAVGVALAVQPLHTWLRHRVRTLVYGEGNDPGRAALSVGRHLSSASTADDLVVSLAVGVREALRLESVTIERSAPGPTASGSPAGPAPWAGPEDHPSGDAVTLPVEHGGRVLGRVHVVARAGERLDARTRDALGSSCPCSVPVSRSPGAHELEEARDATTRARLAERRVIRRELHDGVGPWLVGLRLGLQGARNTLRTDPEAAAAVLDALGSRSRSASTTCARCRAASCRRRSTSTVWRSRSASSRGGRPSAGSSWTCAATRASASTRASPRPRTPSRARASSTPPATPGRRSAA